MCRCCCSCLGEHLPWLTSLSSLSLPDQSTCRGLSALPAQSLDWPLCLVHAAERSSCPAFSAWMARRVSILSSLSIHPQFGPLTDDYMLLRRPTAVVSVLCNADPAWPTCPAVELRQQLRQLPVAAALQLSVTARQLESQEHSLVLALDSHDLLEVRLPELSEAVPGCISASLGMLHDVHLASRLQRSLLS